MATYKIYYNAYIDQESHPYITTKQSAIKIAKSMTSNQVGDFDWDEDAKGLNFCEYVLVEAETEQEAVQFNPEAMPQIKNADYAGVSKLRKAKVA